MTSVGVRCMTAAMLLAAALACWALGRDRDWATVWREFQAGQGLSWPRPSAGSASSPTGLEAALTSGLRVVALVGGVVVVAGAVFAARRLVQRRRRAQTIARWELRLGRDDLANPYQVQEAFEGIAGAIGVRWYERLWTGPQHVAFEIHRLPDRSVRFVVAADPTLLPAVRGPLEDLYPDVELQAVDGVPDWFSAISRLKKRRSFVLSIQTTRNYEHAFAETLVALLANGEGALTVQLLLVPAPAAVHRRARSLLKHREHRLQHADRRDPEELGVDSVVERKELKGALELQHRTLYLVDLRVTGDDPASVTRVAGLFTQLRSENELSRREIRVRRSLYAHRIRCAMPNPLPGLARGVMSTSELATIWQLPRGRVKHGSLIRSSVRRASAPAGIHRVSDTALFRDEHGPVSLAAADRKYGHALIGGQGGGKSSVLARHFRNDTHDPGRAVVLIDPKGPLAQLCLGLAPLDRTVHYLDLSRPEIGVNPLSIRASPGTRAAVFLQALIEANPPGAIQAASDSFLRQAISAVCSVEPTPTLWHVYRMLDLGPSQYRTRVVERLADHDGTEFARRYWHREFPVLMKDRGYAAQALNPPRNKIERLISTREIDTVLRHPVSVDLEGILERREILVVAGAKSSVGEDNAILVNHVLLQLLHRAIQAQQDLPAARRSTVSLLVDEAHNVLTPSVARMLAEGRSAGLEAVFAWQYSAQIRDEVIRSGVRSLLQSISIFRMREIEDARSLAGLAMEVYSDRISIEQEEQERLRFSPDDILRLPVHRAINLWVAGGVPRSGFLAATLPMEPLWSAEVADEHRAQQRDRGGHFPEQLPGLPPKGGDPESSRDAVAAPAPRPRRARRHPTVPEQTQIEGLGA